MRRTRTQYKDFRVTNRLKSLEARKVKKGLLMPYRIFLQSVYMDKDCVKVKLSIEWSQYKVKLRYHVRVYGILN